MTGRIQLWNQATYQCDGFGGGNKGVRSGNDGIACTYSGSYQSPLGGGFEIGAYEFFASIK
jgi:hypothetical protein